MDISKALPFIAMPLLLIIVESAAVLLSMPFRSAGITAFEDPQSLANPVIFLVILLAFTAVLLILIHREYKRLLSLIIAISIFLTFLYIFTALTPYFFNETFAGLISGLILSLAACILLYKYPEWYIIDTLGILLAAGAASIFGVSLDIIPAILLLIVLAVYDTISVYRTGHMITLADGVISVKSPILFVIPKKRGYSFIRDGMGASIGETKRSGDDQPGEREAFMIGMGDLIMPSVLVVSANTFIQSKGMFFLTLPAVCTMVGSLLGLAFLLTRIGHGKPQAGLPPLNGGAIIGCLVGILLMSFWG